MSTYFHRFRKPCKTADTHDKVLSILADCLEKVRKRPNVRSKGPKFTNFVRAGETESSNKEGSGVLGTAGDWDLRADLHRRMEFPTVIAVAIYVVPVYKAGNSCRAHSALGGSDGWGIWEQEGKVTGPGRRTQRRGPVGSSGWSWMSGIYQLFTMEGASNYRHHRGYPETTGGSCRKANGVSITVDLEEESSEVKQRREVNRQY